MIIVDKRLTDIRPYENNPRRNDAAVEKVAASIEAFGFKVPVVIDKDGVIVCGHTRVKAAELLQLETVPCVVADDLTEEQIRAFRIADNKVAEYAEWDAEKLQFELDGILSINMSDFGVLDLDLGSLPDEPDTATDDDFDTDAALAAVEEPLTKRGTIWRLGEHMLMCGDSTSASDVDRLLAGNKADMVFTDPPWNVNYGAVEKGNAQGYKPRTILNDFMGTEDFKNFMVKAFFCMNAISKDGCMTYVVMSAQEWGNLMLALAMSDYHWSSTIIWNKDTLVLSRKDYHTKYEPIWYGWKSGARVHPLEDRKQSDVWDIPRPKRSEEHPTMKPVELVARAVSNSSNAGDIVVDLFGGSGTTLIACEQLKRRCFMMELDPKYCDVIVKRYELLTGLTAEQVV